MCVPNIVLINCDDLGYGDLGCYGSRLNRTPSIDSLAEGGLRLTDFYMASPVCSPSRGGMLTGCYPPRIGFGDFEGEWVLFPGHGVGLSEKETTIAGLLKGRGYRTKLVGKWHCGDQPEFLPTRHGFDEYYGLPYSNDMGRQRTRESSPPLPLMRGERVVEQQPDQRSLTERYVEEATTFIHENRERPFFLYFAHMHVHLPLYANERFHQRSRNGDYGACVEEVDWATQCLLRQIREDGLSENTLIIFTSDNGSRGDHGASNAPLRGIKGTTWEGGQRVPCILYWPGRIPAGNVHSGIFSSLDFLPTFAELCGAKPDPAVKIDGLSFAEVLADPALPSPRDTFFYYRMNNLEAVRRGEWKLHVSKREERVRHLYNLRADIGERNDLIAQHPDIAAELNALLDECRRDLGDEATGVKGGGNRPVGRVENPEPLTAYDESHPYIIAMYDSADIG